MPDHAGTDPGFEVLRQASPWGSSSLRHPRGGGSCLHVQPPHAVSSSPIQICVSKCPDRYQTYLSAYGSRTPSELEYYRQFCVPEFKNLQKVGCWERGVGIPPLAPEMPAFPGSVIPAQSVNVQLVCLHPGSH